MRASKPSLCKGGWILRSKRREGCLAATPHPPRSSAPSPQGEGFWLRVSKPSLCNGARSRAPAVRDEARRKRGSNREQKEAWYARVACDLPL